MKNTDLTDAEYEIIKGLLPAESLAGKIGRPRNSNRLMINGILWILGGGKWTKLPKYYGPKSTVNDRFCFWKKNGLWEKIYDKLCEIRKINNRNIKPKKSNEFDKNEHKKNRIKVEVKKTSLTKSEKEASKEEILKETEQWMDELKEVELSLASYFARSESRERVMEYIKALLSPAKRKNNWQLAEIVGDRTPYGFQYLLGRSKWDADLVCGELGKYIKNHLETPEAVLVVDETSFIKKGTHSVGVAHQYSGLRGCVTNCQVGVFVTYATPKGHVLIDRELYLPKKWTDDPSRCKKVGIPKDKSFSTKPELACKMFERIFASGITAKWVTGDSVYGGNNSLRLWLEKHQQAYVLSVTSQEFVSISGQQYQVSTVFDSMLSDQWLCLSAGDGTKGPRWYNWQWLPLQVPHCSNWNHWLLIRRSISDPSEMRAYIVFAPEETSLDQAIKIAGIRWTVEICFEATKGEVGIADYEVRNWQGWYRHVTLAMWTYAFLIVVKAQSPNNISFLKKKVLHLTTGSLAIFKTRRDF